MSENELLERLAALEIETPSWGYGNSGTRSHVYPWPGAARTVWERLDDAALVHRLTGCCPSVALQIPWDRVDDWAALARYAVDRGIQIGAINPNLFGDDAYWGTAALICRRLGPQAQVLVDTGHHPQGTNVEQIVALLLAEGLLGGFHFNSRKHADDDLIAGAFDPFELFRIMREIALAPGTDQIAFMIDQSHNIEGKIDAMIQSVMNIQTAYAKALLVDEGRLAVAQAEGGRPRRPPDLADSVRDRRAAAPCHPQATARSRSRSRRGVSSWRLPRTPRKRTRDRVGRKRVRALVKAIGLI